MEYTNENGVVNGNFITIIMLTTNPKPNTNLKSKPNTDYCEKHAGKNLPFLTKNIIKMLLTTKLKKLPCVSSFICLLCMCKISSDLIERFLLYGYLNKHPEIQDGCRYLGNATPQEQKIVCIFIIFYAEHNKNKMALISIGIKIFV